MLYWHPYNEEWVVATRGSVLASGSVGDLDKTFTELFWETAAKYPNFNLEETQDKNVTFVFELFGPENFVLTPYEESELRLLAARNIDTLEEMDNDYLNQVSEDWGIPRPRLYSFNTKEDILKIIEDFEATDEGFVLVDYEHRDNGNFQRVKIKNPRYVALHALLNAGNGNVFNKKCMLERILSGDAEEIITYFPKYEGYIRKIQDELDELCVMIQKDYERLAAMNLDKKAFAEEAKKTVWLHVLFAVNNGKVKNAREFVFAMRTETLLDLLEKTGIGE
jgi:hypothetical protein